MQGSAHPGSNGLLSMYCCGPQLPAFAVPAGADPFDEDTQRSLVALQQFVEALCSGVSMRVELGGGGSLEVQAWMDRERTRLELVFNQVRQQVVFWTVRNISIQEGPKANSVMLELDGGRFCTFVFSGGPTGSKEASYFGACVHLLVEAARFDVVRGELKDLDVLAAEVEDDGLPTGAATVRSQVSTADVRSSRDAPPGASSAEILEGHSAKRLLSALKALNSGQD